MVVKKISALSGAAAAIALVLATAAVARQAPVTIRIEGKTRALLSQTVARTHGGSITTGGAPNGACPGSSAQGALDVATHHRWSGKWFGSLGSYELFTILGDHESGTQAFWEILVNNVPASAGACELKLHPGDQLLFAVVPVKGTAYPLGISAPSTAVAGHPFAVKVTWFDAKGHAKPLAGAVVNGKRTNHSGVVRIVASKAGTLVVRAGKNGYIRDETSVKVS
jgi:hypothetical protein